MSANSLVPDLSVNLPVFDYILLFHATLTSI